MSDIDTTNKYCVGMHNGGLVVLRPPTKLTVDDALNLAAWLVALSGDRDRFNEILDAVEAT